MQTVSENGTHKYSENRYLRQAPIHFFPTQPGVRIQEKEEGGSLLNRNSVLLTILSCLFLYDQDHFHIFRFRFHKSV